MDELKSRKLLQEQAGTARRLCAVLVKHARWEENESAVEALERIIAERDAAVDARAEERRDADARAALAGIIASPSSVASTKGWRALEAYRYADALAKARKKGGDDAEA